MARFVDINALNTFLMSIETPLILELDN